MRLLSVSGLPIDYPDLARDAPVCVEVCSVAPAFGYDALADEVRALAFASLAVQLEAGRPVLKMLNLTTLIEGDSTLIAPTLNFLAGAVQERAYVPSVVLREAIDEASPEFRGEFGRLPDELQRVDRFIRAVGFDISAPELNTPSLHISLDQWRSPGAIGGGISAPMSELTAPLAAGSAWWTGFEKAESARLCRPDVSADDHLSQPTMVPLPYLRAAASYGSGPGLLAPHRVTSVIGDRGVVGFSLRSSGPLPRTHEYRQALTDATFRAVSAFLAQDRAHSAPGLPLG